MNRGRSSLNEPKREAEFDVTLRVQRVREEQPIKKF